VFRRLPFSHTAICFGARNCRRNHLFFTANIITVNPNHRPRLTYLLAISSSFHIFVGLSRFSAFIGRSPQCWPSIIFSLPPVGKFTISDPQNWAALVAFSRDNPLIASRLCQRAFRREGRRSAAAPQKKIERLYAFSQQLLVSGNVITLLNSIPNHIVETF